MVPKRTATLESALVLTSMMLSVGWLLSCYLFPDSWQNSNDSLNQVATDILSSGGIFLCGVALLTHANVRRQSRWFAVTVLVAPIAHYIGSQVNEPGCHPFFVAPSALILVSGLVKLRGSATTP
jgi:hypothetical protein